MNLDLCSMVSSFIVEDEAQQSSDGSLVENECDIFEGSDYLRKINIINE